MTKNTLYYGDNLKIIREHIPHNFVDLIYLDPPFNSKAGYNILYKEPSGKPSDAQVRAFEDTWHWTSETEKIFQEIVETATADVIEMMRAFRQFVGINDMMAYLTMMCIRIIELKKVLKNTGSIYLHCDPTASHYLKILMDTVFGKQNFRNEIVWCYRGAGYPKKDFGKRHDIIFRYSKTPEYIFNLDDVREEYAEATKERFKHYIGNIRKGKDFGLQSLHPLGKQPDDWWQIQPIAPSAKERLGYPTQKPLALLEKIVKASSKEGDTILDPFCGCGTTIAVAQKFNRKWMGIDITHLAIKVIKDRMKYMFMLEPKTDYEIVGEPEDLEGAKELANQNRHEFQWWASSLIPNARPYENKKKGADTGIDGYVYFLEGQNKVRKAIIQVKSGKVGVSDIRDLGYVINREGAELGIFITLLPPTRNMKKEAAAMGHYESTIFEKKYYPRLQIFTIKDLLSGKKPQIPHTVSPYKKAEIASTQEQPILSNS